MAPKAVVTEGSPTAVPVHTRDELVNELAAVGLEVLDTRDARTNANKQFNSKIKSLEKRYRELATTVKSAGIRESIQMNFGSLAAATAREPGDEDDN